MYAVEVALRGESVAGDIPLRLPLAVETRSFLRPLEDFAEMGVTMPVSGDVLSDFMNTLPLGNETLVAVDGCEAADGGTLSPGYLGKFIAGLTGL